MNEFWFVIVVAVTVTVLVFVARQPWKHKPPPSKSGGGKPSEARRPSKK